MDVQCLKVRLKEGTTEQVVNWMKDLYNKMDLVRESLADETMVVESVFLERGKDADYLIFYTRAESLEKANKAMLVSKNPVDVSAREIINETWEEVTPLEILFDVDRIDKIKD